jgi:hypothetical protein
LRSSELNIDSGTSIEEILKPIDVFMMNESFMKLKKYLEELDKTKQQTFKSENSLVKGENFSQLDSNSFISSRNGDTVQNKLTKCMRTAGRGIRRESVADLSKTNISHFENSLTGKQFESLVSSTSSSDSEAVDSSMYIKEIEEYEELLRILSNTTSPNQKLNLLRYLTSNPIFANEKDFNSDLISPPPQFLRQITNLTSLTLINNIRVHSTCHKYFKNIQTCISFSKKL